MVDSLDGDSYPEKDGPPSRTHCGRRAIQASSCSTAFAERSDRMLCCDMNRDRHNQVCPSFEVLPGEGWLNVAQHERVQRAIGRHFDGQVRARDVLQEPEGRITLCCTRKQLDKLRAASASMVAFHHNKDRQTPEKSNQKPQVRAESPHYVCRHGQRCACICAQVLRAYISARLAASQAPG